MSDSVTWTNECRKLRDLIPWERNPREINKREAERLGESLAEFGQVQTIAIGPGNEVYDGHQRKIVWSLLPQFGPDYEVDVRVASRALTEKERQKLVIFLHRGTLGQWDWDELANSFELPELLEWGFEEAELQLDWRSDEPTPDPGAQVDKAAELQEKWQVKKGDVWVVGRHRVMCGDSTNAEDVARLMGGEKAHLVMADPPYNVQYTGGSTNDSERSDSYADDMSDGEYTAWLKSILRNGIEFSDGQSALMLWFASAKMRCVIDSFEGAGWVARTLIVWNKLKAHYGALGAQYKHRFEPLWYCYKPNNAPRFYGATNEVTVWDMDQPHVNELHPTMKPIELYQRCITNHTRLSGPVLELFLGSGTTAVAAEQTGRLCRGMEIEPKYVAVSLQRLTDLGLEAHLVDG